MPDTDLLDRLPTLADVLAAVERLHAEMRSEIASLRRDVANKQRQDEKRRKATAARVLPCIADAWGADRAFATGDLIEFAEELDTEPRLALREALRELGDTPQKVGIRLARIAGLRGGGYQLERIGDDRLGTIFCLRNCEASSSARTCGVTR